MATASSMRRAFLAAWLALVLLASLPAYAAEGYIGTPGDAARAAGLVTEALGRKAQVHTIRITEKDVTVLVRGDARPGDVEEWKVRTANRFFFFPSEGVSGPSAKQAPAIVADPAGGFFSFDDIALDKVSEVVGRAIAYARLQDTATIQTIEIARRVNLLPTPTYGDIRWTLYVSSPRETATVYTDAAGTIIGGDLSNTVLARNMDFYKDDDWPKETALESLISVIGTKPIVRDITIYPKSVQVKADHPTLPETTVGYSWDLSGVTRSAITSPMFPGTAQQPALSLADIDLAPFARVRDNAIKAWGNEKSSLNYLMLRLFSEGPGKPEQRWTVHFTDWGQPGELALFSNGGSIELTADGTVRVANLPAARQPKRNWLDPKTTRETLAAVSEQFGKNARFSEISVNNDSMRILAEVPDTPGKMRDYNANDRGITASSMMMPWDAEFRPERLYRMDDLAFFSAEKLNELTARTFTRLKVGSDMALSRYTFSIGQLPTPDGSFMVPSPDGKVTLEIRLEGPDGWKGGRVTYSSTGEEIDVVMP